MFARHSRGWRQQAIIKNPLHGKHTGLYGWSVAISSTTLAVSAVDDANGRVFIYGRSGSHWRQEAVLRPPGSPKDPASFGESIAMSGSLLLIGSPGSGLNEDGAAYLYRGSGSAWQLTATLPYPPGGKHDTFFGGAVALTGSIAVVGASDADQAFVFVRSGAKWQARGPAHGPGTEIAQGRWLRLDGVRVRYDSDRRALSAGPDFVGQAYIYTPRGRTWRWRATLTPPHPAPGNSFAESVAVSGNRILVGEPVAWHSKCGAAFEYLHERKGWRLHAKIVDPRCSTSGLFGYEVALNGRVAAISAQGSAGPKETPGFVFILRLP